MVKAFAAAQDGEPKWTKSWLAMTILAGMIFLGIQVHLRQPRQQEKRP